ncbi:hypothetical protein ACWDOP_02440 [Nocardia sp. NPDC003693]
MTVEGIGADGEWRVNQPGTGVFADGRPGIEVGIPASVTLLESILELALPIWVPDLQVRAELTPHYRFGCKFVSMSSAGRVRRPSLVVPGSARGGGHDWPRRSADVDD